ncbi:gamma-glutamyltransferase [bacterium]|nr:gamma-glutamyltransferase [bacterium]
MKKYFFALLLFTSLNAHAYQAAVVSAHPTASRIGLKVMENGGSAADAAIATAFALAVLEPQNSGLGGGGFLLYYQKSENRYYFIDYREAAPASLKVSKPVESGIQSVATPGFVAGMEEIHNKWRKASWPALIDPAIDLAKKGILAKISLKNKINDSKDKFNDAATAVFVDPLNNGKSSITQTDLATTLENIKTGGAKEFYKGDLSKKIASFSKSLGGSLNAADLANYKVYWRKTHQFNFKGYNFISSPLPSSGGAGLEYLFRRAVVNNLANEKLNPDRYATLLIDSYKDYFSYREMALGDTSTNFVAHTTHLSVIDKDGNMASMTNTINSPFGSGLIVPGTGIVLNNEMDDFSTTPGSANQIRAARRPLSSMAPTIVAKNWVPKLIIGTPGGKTIPLNLFQVLFPYVGWKAPLAKEVMKPKIYYNPAKDAVVAEEKYSSKVLESLKEDNTVETEKSIGNIQALIILSEHQTQTLSDPRGEGGGARE